MCVHTSFWGIIERDDEECDERKSESRLFLSSSNNNKHLSTHTYSLTHSIRPIQLDADKTRFRIVLSFFLVTAMTTELAGKIAIYRVMAIATCWYLKFLYPLGKKDRRLRGRERRECASMNDTNMILFRYFSSAMHRIFVWERYIVICNEKMPRKHNRIVSRWRSSAARRNQRRKKRRREEVDSINSGIVREHVVELIWTHAHTQTWVLSDRRASARVRE